ncbi:phosphoribosylglycinamide formyltransferase [Shimazuella sp. AN120528]|uniref:phosphoribosylglycinamide formyltransferase n=1 Tax=Shimazuella soli TaxID=1892854 RepID=UPI001F104F0D|nr:phosphoribosylglycinamide formyltransferase [Shimazuella soli]MCH5586602.1 phosphoribosylglycinamide formyltransferase [Shimazuella soli]
MSIAVFASGSGSNFESIVNQSRKDNWPMSVSLLISDREGAKVLDRAERLDVPHYLVSPKSFPNKEAYESALLEVLEEKKIDWIILAGYMRLIGPTLLGKFKGRIVNIHPSLLPAFVGKNAIEQAFEYPVKVSGVTVHFVDEGMDTGPIIAQVPVAIEENDTLTTYTQKIQAVEHQLYPEVVKQLVTGRMKNV